jgi:hypothetical protein
MLKHAAGAVLSAAEARHGWLLLQRLVIAVLCRAAEVKYLARLRLDMPKAFADAIGANVGRFALVDGTQWSTEEFHASLDAVDARDGLYVAPTGYPVVDGVLLYTRVTKTGRATKRERKRVGLQVTASRTHTIRARAHGAEFYARFGNEVAAVTPLRDFEWPKTTDGIGRHGFHLVEAEGGGRVEDSGEDYNEH